MAKKKTIIELLNQASQGTLRHQAAEDFVGKLEELRNQIEVVIDAANDYANAEEREARSLTYQQLTSDASDLYADVCAEFNVKAPEKRQRKEAPA